LIAAFAVIPARAAVIVTGEPDDVGFRASLVAVTGRPTSALGAVSAGDAGSRGVVYVFKLPTSDTGQSNVSAADFRFTVASAKTKPTYGIDLYAIPARSTATPLDSDFFFGPLETVVPLTGATTRIVDNLVLPDTVTTPKEVLVPFTADSSFVDFLNAQYASGANPKYLFLRLNPDVLVTSAIEDSGWNVNMWESPTGRPTLTLAFVPEPAITLPAALVLLATRRRRRADSSTPPKAF
jgi:hypothetical protein